LDKDFEDFAAKRCEKVIEEDTDYMCNEINGVLDQEELQAKAEILCYFQGMKDMAQFIGINVTISLTSDMIGSRGSQKR